LSRLQIIIPRWAEQPAFICNVPQADGSPCGVTFYADERRKYRLHVEKCAQAHAEEIHNDSPRRKLAELHEGGDLELQGWAHEHSEEIIEGRKKL
jgi:hypothetical protein